MEKYLQNKAYIHIPVFVLNALGVVFSLGVVFFGIIWSGHFINHIQYVKRKIKAIKGYTNHIERERYINAVIDYKKSVFLTIISFTESWLHVFFWIIISYPQIKENSQNNTLPQFAEVLENDTLYDVLVIISMTIFIFLGSLVCMLTSYLTKAYDTKREINFNEYPLFIWLVIQLAIGWTISLIPGWRSECVPIYTIGICVAQIIVYVRKAKKLYCVLRRRRIDAYFEDMDLYKNLIAMCENFKYGAMLYTTNLVLYLSELVISIIQYFFVGIFIKIQFLEETLHIRDPFNSVKYDDKKVLHDIHHVFTYVISFITMLMLFFSFMLHLLIVLRAIVRRIQKKRAMNSEMRNVQNMLYRPLIEES